MRAPAARDPAAGSVSASHSPHSAHRLSLECGDTYEGACESRHGVRLPHGRGVWRSADGLLRFEGAFVQRWRDGYGRLCTPTFTLWARWRMDRPDLASTTRVDYPDGGRYCGFVELRVRQQPSASSSAPLRSRFHTWAASIEPSRHRWGELVSAGGDRYVGEWVENEREGFGCYVWASGSRYAGRFRRGQFHDTGTLFVVAAEVDGCLARLCSAGGWRCGESAGEGSPAAASCGAARWPPASRPGWDGVVVDVVWCEGRCRGEGHVTLPAGIRVSADWRTAASPVEGEVVLPVLSPQARTDPDVYEWRESFQWESLLGNAAPEARQAAFDKAEGARVGVRQSNSTEYVRSCVLELLTGHDVTKTALHVFRRCFYCLYGTCGVDAEVGAGGLGNPLGWCTLRNAYGGCVHPPRGRPITAGDLDLALRDVASLARSVVRWLLDMVGPELQSKVLDCGGEAVVGRWVADRVFQHCYPVLLNLYSHVYASAEAALASSVARLRDAVTLDDMGVVFARQSESQARLFDPYTDAVHCLEQLNDETQTLTKLLKVLVQWSREIDLSTRLTQASADGRHKTSASAAGSADDLLPIHQYVLSQSRCARLYAVTRLLSDFAAEPLFMEATSHDAFGVTTLQVCVVTLLRLHPWERDAAGVLVPFSVTLDGVRDAVGRRAALAAWVLEARASGSLRRPSSPSHAASSTPPPTTRASAEDVEAAEYVMQRYAALWVPRVVGWVGEHAAEAAAPRRLCATGLPEAEAAARLGPPFADAATEALCLACWLYTSALLGAAHVRLLLGSQPVPHTLQRYEDVAATCAQLRQVCAAADAAAATLATAPNTDDASVSLWVQAMPDGQPPIPSHLLRMEKHLVELLRDG